MISDFFPNKIYAEIIEISDFIFFALFWVPENAQTRGVQGLQIFFQDLIFYKWAAEIKKGGFHGRKVFWDN